MNNETKNKSIILKMKKYNLILKDLLVQIKIVEEDINGDLNERLCKIKKIKEEITKVGTEIDNARKELTLVDYSIN
jgi:hypothetical protein